MRKVHAKEVSGTKSFGSSQTLPESKHTFLEWVSPPLVPSYWHQTPVPLPAPPRTSDINQQYLPKCVESVVFCAMAPLQKRLYEFFLSSVPVSQSRSPSVSHIASKAFPCASHIPYLCPFYQVRRTLQGATRDKSSGEVNLHPLPAITALKKLCLHPDMVR